MSNLKNFFLLVLFEVFLFQQNIKAQNDLPNILWITSEDNSPFFMLAESAKGFALFASYDISKCKTILEKWRVIERLTEGFYF